ncbi:MAG: hypothetical protein RLZ10_2932 [Bacteroidota bacterium]|jgi:hypothetical protein
MKKFLLKSVLYLFGWIMSGFFLMMYLGVFKKQEKLNFVSNSISFNSKASFIYKNKLKLKNADYVIIGSSMSLNNIDGEYLEKISNKRVINLSSWGMKIHDFKGFLTRIHSNSTIIVNISFTDFGKTWIEKYSHFPFGDQNEYSNKLSNLSTFRQQVDQVGKYTNDSASRDYTSLNFDNTGSVLLSKRNFHISPKRWEGVYDAPSILELENFVDQLAFLEKYKVYLFFSPERGKYKTTNKYNSLSRLEAELKCRYRNVLFFNNYNQNYSDSMFVDCYHFNDEGAKKYSELIHEQINSF